MKKEGQTTWLSVNSKLIRPLHNESDVPSVLLTMADITLQKEQQIKLRESNALRRTLIDSLPIGILVVDNDMNIVALNRPFCKMFKIDEPLKNLIGKSCLPYRKAILRNWGTSTFSEESILSDGKAGTKEFETLDDRTLKQGYFPFYHDNELKGHLWTFEDVTEQKMMDREILFAKEEAIKANLAKSEFLSNMSHELRTPLNGILGFSQLLELDGALTEQQRKFVLEILKGGRHLLDLINEILDLSRIETGKLKINKERVRVKDVINECINLVTPSSREKSIVIQSTFLDCPKNEILVDVIRLRQIILNLLDNAIKYNREGGKVTLTCGMKEGRLIIHVIDDGIGIPISEQERIFDPFYRLENHQVEGAGIGLSLVKQLILLMGGDISLKSTVGSGSDFSFWLPVHQTENQVLKDHESHEILQKARRDIHKILYVEDNPSNLALVKEILGAQRGYELRSATTGQEGLEKAKESGISLILLDIHLPDMTGFEVLDKLKQNDLTNHIPVIALSANAMQADIDKALARGFKEYITKPIHIRSFLRLVDKYL
ncbi:PAS domain-containing hybrid sensor histidine kinase/response regulator [Peribacillus acanthi]|uniref:hybrid sensor histidine kinase/response regulator n=1 Tax=Peribacillus acanthi TaxID=2171554 RepID=UPI000D3E5DC3|nr:PAS domain-containing hybrid sensor histidine kinase/response regulator [Peribacillus acanthi]